MDDDKRNVGKIGTNMKLGDLDRTIQYARLRCLSVEQITDRIAKLDESGDVNDYVRRLFEMQLAESEMERLVDVMDALAQRSETAPSKLKVKLDRTLLRLVRLLPSDLANRFAEPFVDHRRKARRQWAYSALREKQISQSVAFKLLNVFHITGDQEALQLIARNPERVAKIGAEVLLENIDDEYWRARVIEALLFCERQTALGLSHQYPFEFAHAAGRVEDKSLLEPLCELFEHNKDDVEFLSIYAYALGKLKGLDRLRSLEEFVAATYSDISDKCVANATGFASSRIDADCEASFNEKSGD